MISERISICELPIGSLRTDFHKNCLDCLQPDEQGDFNFRNTYSLPLLDEPLIEEYYIGRDNCKKSRMVRQLEHLDYCYYHAKKRGLLPYQNEQEWDSY